MEAVGPHMVSTRSLSCGMLQEELGGVASLCWAGEGCVPAMLVRPLLSFSKPFLRKPLGVRTWAWKVRLKKSHVRLISGA